MRITCAQLAARLRAFPGKLEKEVKKAEGQSLVKARIIARKWSSGTIKTATLIALGHPYSKRDPNPPQDPAIINFQTGLFKSMWIPSSVNFTLSNHVITGRLKNDAPYGYKMENSFLMIRRPILDRIVKEIEPIRYANLERAVERAMR